MTKLTEPQRRLLDDVAAQRYTCCLGSYKPAQKLRQLGLVHVQERAYERWELTLTEAGKAALHRAR